MRLYYFTTQKYGLMALRNRRLKISRISELNDPFELLGWDLSDVDIRRKLTAWKQQRSDEYGIICFSHKWSNPLLWGHYAERHKGMALGFDVPDDDTFNPVHYRRKRLAIPAREITGADVDAILLTKFSAWRYEAEYRSIYRLADAIKIGALYFERFSQHLRLSQVILGDRSTVSRAQLAKALGRQMDHVDRFKARPAFQTFSVVRNRDDKLWL